MKKIWKQAIILQIILMLNITICLSQITLDGIVDSLFLAYQFKAVQLSPSETKYFFADTSANTFSLYNMDFSPFLLNISVPQPYALTTIGFQALYITRALFDCDTSNIEYAYTSPADNNQPFRVMRTDGTLLFQLDSANGPYCAGNCLGYSDFIRPIINTSDGAKLFLQKYNAGYEQIFIYSLCGTLPNDVFDLSQNSQVYVTLFPNPSSTTLTFKINPPDNMNEFELVILDISSRVVKREKISAQNLKIVLDTSNMSMGTYFYSLCTNSKAYQSGKFIILK